MHGQIEDGTDRGSVLLLNDYKTWCLMHLPLKEIAANFGAIDEQRRLKFTSERIRS